MFERELLRVTKNLPSPIAVWMARAIRSGWFEIRSGEYEAGDGRAVCPVIAAAMLAEVWRDGRLLPGNELWGTEMGPSQVVEDFASYFDLCAEEAGIEVAVQVIAEGLAETRCSHEGSTWELAA